ncbi:MAG: RrF2 family transcriptional regulator [Clostridiales bacterium]|nr:RrF2 family transcriptional regulator [Clostridiales bacterium]
MRVSTRARYGINAVFELAKNYQGEPIAIKTISERQKIPMQYLEQLIVKLRKAGIVNSLRGAKGGYTIAKKPKDITAWDVIACLEGAFAPIHCKRYEEEGCDHEDDCAGQHIWTKVNSSVMQAVENITFADLIKEFKEK